MIEKSEQRPWGSWHVIDEGNGYKVKRIHVKPGCRLSYQAHDHRSEHWVVIYGIAKCVIDDETITAGPGHSIDVPQGAKQLAQHLERQRATVALKAREGQALAASLKN